MTGEGRPESVRPGGYNINDASDARLLLAGKSLENRQAAGPSRDRRPASFGARLTRQAGRTTT
ncbi:hypothetical protein Skr01_34350 [Sphaerisporangium krabiense]|nr:hypothetical protein Skr01_34350 [Sphaerisporangium krabiense]